MKRVFVFQDFKSQKFWSIDVVGTDVTVNYGKLGTDGQTQVKNYSTAEEAEKAANKLIAEKTKKGYVETAEETAREMKVEAKKMKDFFLYMSVRDMPIPIIVRSSYCRILIFFPRIRKRCCKSNLIITV